MPERIDPRGEDNLSTYVVEDRSSNPEMIRLMIQDQLVTAGMGGPLAEQLDPAALRHILDIGCGPGGWLLETAARYPYMSLVGIDISWRMIEYATAQAKAQNLTDRVEFRVMDATKLLDFPDASFDLVNMRFGSSFLLAEMWPALLYELLRVVRPGGIVRLVDSEVVKSNSPAYTQLVAMSLCALGKAGYLFAQESTGLTRALPRLLTECGVLNVQAKAYTLEYLAGTVGGQQVYHDAMYGFQTLLPFLQKWGCAPDDYDAVYQQAMIEMQQPDFRATWDQVITWGKKVEPSL